MFRTLFLFAALLLALASPSALGQTQNQTSTNAATHIFPGHRGRHLLSHSRT